MENNKIRVSVDLVFCFPDSPKKPLEIKACLGLVSRTGLEPVTT